MFSAEYGLFVMGAAFSHFACSRSAMVPVETFRDFFTGTIYPVAEEEARSAQGAASRLSPSIVRRNTTPVPSGFFRPARSCVVRYPAVSFYFRQFTRRRVNVRRLFNDIFATAYLAWAVTVRRVVRRFVHPRKTSN